MFAGTNRLLLVVITISIGTALLTAFATPATAVHPAIAGGGPSLPDSLGPLSHDLSPVPDPVSAFAQGQDGPTATASTVFPPDDRIPVTDTTKAPWRSVAFLIIYDYPGHIHHTCTGSMVNYNVVLTAAHCLFDPHDGWVSSVVVAPGATKDGAPFGLASAFRMSVPKGWSTSQESTFDFGLVFLDGAPFGSLTGPFLTVASVTDSYFNRPDIAIATAGFPGDEPVGSMWFTGSFYYFADKDIIYTKMDAYPGQSGSPIYSVNTSNPEVFVVGVFSAESANYNLAVRFTPDHIKALNQYCANAGCTLYSKVLADDFKFSSYSFCTSSPECRNGSEPLYAGRKAYVSFALSPATTDAIYAEAYWNGTKYTSASWDARSQPVSGVFFIKDPGASVRQPALGRLKCAYGLAPHMPALSPAAFPRHLLLQRQPRAPRHRRLRIDRSDRSCQCSRETDSAPVDHYVWIGDEVDSWATSHKRAWALRSAPREIPDSSSK